ncbi:MAG: SpoIID/LytB domain-containing protein [Armatimonadota bacterium]|nr:MAG: SpoIID/LytB domain-containing protein [Armatimonadota bacterium]
MSLAANASGYELSITGLPATIRVLMPGGTVQEMSLEEYTKGVLPSELYASWPTEALKAGAVAMRCYAATSWRHDDVGANVCTTTHCQVWSPARDPRTDAAVDATSGVAATHDGCVIAGYHFSHCDGTTRNSEDVWGEYLAYCRGVPCGCGYDFMGGHGVGMCQWGAWAMGAAGYDYTEILQHYYTGVAIVDFTTFDDVPVGYWAHDAIEAIYREGITGGCSAVPPLYCPAGSVTRGQMAAFICRAAGKSWLDPGTATFADVARGENGQWDGGGSGGLDADGTHVFYGWIERLAHPESWGGTAPTVGCGAGVYCPGSSCTRGQMAAFLSRAHGKTWLDLGTATFGDALRGENGQWDGGGTGGLDADGTYIFYGWIERLADPGSWTTPPTAGCAAGPPPLYCPANNCRRDQMAVFLCRAFEIPY